MTRLPRVPALRRAALVVPGACTLALVAPLCGQLHAQAKGRAPATRPATPQNVRATRTSPTQVTLTWDAVSGATGYAIGRHVPPAGWVSVTRVSAGVTRFVDGGRDLSASHQYRVNALAGDMASLPALSNLLAPDAPVTAAQADGAPGPKDQGAPPADKASVAAGCQPFGGHHVCRGERVTFEPGAGNTKSAVAYCPTASHVPVGGGWSGDFRGEAEVEQSIPTIDVAKGRPGWQVQVRRVNLDLRDRVTEQVATVTGGNPRPVYVQSYVVCAPALSR